jgi:hypothetical protein
MGSNLSPTLRLAVWSSALLIGAVVVGIAGRIQPMGELLSMLWVPALVMAVIAGTAAVVVGAVFPWPSRDPREAADTEPVLGRVSAPDREAHPYVLALRQLEPRAGSSTLAFNIAVKVATDGMVDGRRPRPLCLLSEGELTRVLALESEPLRAYLTERPVSPDEDVLGLAIRHATGCELICMGPGAPNGQQLRLLMPILRRYYDPIVIDCRPDDRWLTEVAVDTCDVLLLVGLPTPDSAVGAARWADAGWERGITGQMAEVTNQLRAAAVGGLGSGLQHRASIPEDPLVVSSDLKGVPWILDFDSRAAAAASDLVERLLPRVMGVREGEHAA